MQHNDILKSWGNNLLFPRVEDHDDLMHIFAEQITPLVESHGPYFLSELIEAQDQESHAAVCEVSQVLFTIERLKMNMDNKAQNILGT